MKVIFRYKCKNYLASLLLFPQADTGKVEMKKIFHFEEDLKCVIYLNFSINIKSYIMYQQSRHAL